MWFKSMSYTSIKVQNLGKQYRIGQRQGPYKTIRETISDTLAAPIRRLRGKTVQSEESLFWALQAVSFEVRQGEVVGVIGRNGAGKSTLLKILARITEPTTGSVDIYGRIGSLLEVGTGFHPELTGRENIYLNGAILGMKRTEIARKFDEIVDFAEIEKFLDTAVKHYSSGMYMRLAFSVAAHLEPEILLVDEVLAVGDMQFQQKCLGKMSDVAQQGRTVVFVSHNMAAVEHLCKYGIFLQNGQVAYSGTQTEAIAAYVQSLQSGYQSLKSLKERGGSGDLQITSVTFRDKEKNIVNSIQSGQPVDICLHYTGNPQSWSGEIIVGISLTSQQGLKVFSLSNRVTRDSFKNPPAQGVFTCQFSQLPLPASTYQISFNVKIGEEYTDSVQDAIELIVVDGDFFGTGISLPPSSGVCLVTGKWQLETVNN
jgi:lipopolysaccharide transport system ATP-binding protein